MNKNLINLFFHVTPKGMLLMNNLRSILWLACGLLALLPVTTACAQESYPSRPVVLIVPGAAGTGVDTIARLAAQKLGEVFGGRVLVENVVGASGILGVQRVTRARPDGYTLLFTFNQTITMNPGLINNLPYDPDKDLEPISLFAQSPFVWMVNSDVPVKTFPEMVAHAKANPGKLAVGVTGFGAAAYLGTQLLSHHTGAEFLPVNYSGNIAPDLLSNVVQLTMSPAAVVAGLVATGKVRALAQTGTSRARNLADVPTVSEFVPGYVIDAWYSVWAPRGTPKPVVEQLTAAWKRIAALPEVGQRLMALSAAPVGSSAEELAEITRRETRMWGELVKVRNLKPVQ